jgi:hypothetical protein
MGSALLAVQALLGAVALAATVPSGFVDSIFVGVPSGRDRDEVLARWTSLRLPAKR